MTHTLSPRGAQVHANSKSRLPPTVVIRGGVGVVGELALPGGNCRLSDWIYY